MYINIYKNKRICLVDKSGNNKMKIEGKNVKIIIYGRFMNKKEGNYVGWTKELELFHKKTEEKLVNIQYLQTKRLVIGYKHKQTTN